MYIIFISHVKYKRHTRKCAFFVLSSVAPLSFRQSRAPVFEALLCTLPLGERPVLPLRSDFHPHCGHGLALTKITSSRCRTHKAFYALTAPSFLQLSALPGDSPLVSVHYTQALLFSTLALRDLMQTPKFKCHSYHMTPPSPARRPYFQHKSHPHGSRPTRSNGQTPQTQCI